MEDVEARFTHLLQPIRDLTKNWEVDVAAHLGEYLEEVRGRGPGGPGEVGPWEGRPPAAPSRTRRPGRPGRPPQLSSRALQAVQRVGRCLALRSCVFQAFPL